jgi:type IV pilus biogenesis protein PilP
MIATFHNFQHAARSAKHCGQGVALAAALSVAASLAQAATPALPDPLAALPGEASLKPAQLAAKPASVPAPAAKVAVVSPAASPAPVVLAAARQSPASASAANFPTPLLRPVQLQNAAAIVPPAPHAAPTSNVATLRQLDELRSQIALATEQVQLAELRAKLPAAPSAAQPRTAATATQNARSAQVVSVYGLNDQLTAVVQLSTGGIVKARVGSTIPGIGTVQSIAHNEVKVSTTAGVLSLNIAPIAQEVR